MFATNLTALRRRAIATLARLRRGRIAACLREENGQSAVELALCLPALLMVVTGITTFGIAMNNYIMLTNATNVAARQLALQRGQGTDPCSVAYNAVVAAAPLLKSANLTITYSINGVAYPNTTNTSATTCTSATTNLVQGGAAQVTVTYPASLKIYSKTISSSFNLKAQTSEYIQ